MNVTVSVGGKFHGFDLAGQLEQRGRLARLITSYPKFAVDAYGIPRRKVVSLLLRELMERGWRKGMPAFVKDRWNYSFLVNDVFDRMAVPFVGSSDIFVGWSSEFLRSARAAKRNGTKLTVVERGSSHMEYQRDILREEYGRFGLTPQLPHPKLVQKELAEYAAADYISIPSLFVKRTFLERGVPERKLIHVPYGVDLTRFRQVPKEDDVFRIVFAGGMTVRKGVQYLLQAFAELALPNAELLLVGTMNDEARPFFKKYEGSYTYVGHVPQADLYREYSRGSVFVMMSVEEGLALVQAQAMACGLPVIATTNTGAEDIVRDGTDGFIIPIRGVEALKEKLQYLYEHPDVCRAMGRSAKEHVASGFTWDDYGRRMVAEYERVLSGYTKGTNGGVA